MTAPFALAIEDDQPVRAFIARLLIDEGYQVLEAGDGVQALEHLAQRKADIALAVVDLIMPRMNGFELLHAGPLRDAGIPLIAVTANLSLTEAEEKRLGGAPLLFKPFTVASFTAALRAALHPPPEGSYTIDEENHLAIVRAPATPSSSAAIAIASRIWADARFVRGFGIVIDRRGFSEPPALETLMAVFDYLGQRESRMMHPSRWAVVADRPRALEAWRGAESVAASAGVKMRAFQDYDEATGWAQSE